jgi:hypothetical protein
MSFLSELERRKVFGAGIARLPGAWVNRSGIATGLPARARFSLRTH